MLGTESNPDQPCRDRPKKREVRQEPKEKWRRESARTTQYATDSGILEKDLQSLRHDRRRCPALLNLVQIPDYHLVFAQRCSQQVRCGNCIRRMNRISTEIAQKIRMLFQYQHVN